MNGCIYCNEYDVCMKYTTDKATSFCAGKNCRDREPSNSDRIRSMTDEELADWLTVLCWYPVEKYGIEPVKDWWVNWLKRDSEEWKKV